MRDVFGAMHVGLVEGDERPVSGRSSPAIRVPPTGAAAVDAYLALPGDRLDEPLLMGVERDTLTCLFADAARQAQLASTPMTFDGPPRLSCWRRRDSRPGTWRCTAGP